ncbi:very long-chain acyl-CoA synthetase-like [Mizuhopecten yessoensis]|uniref:long-chain-fatty-acid--CoA ligase n=1 Tax=Mizuhopecten yessoensis TaxID=6573 RepID=A0A210R310_MIZYE|nr:very long-chain acyl-CoA synthetase-like [Mizuhopecten yessoensis]XP_021370919.1 very long-chain acyl-CoA synthetase-like [Mizuhopecten yessoensis]XP_021370928.1 very long-chain acyl-CoA synthetase-like [Mizuhopecten yessoensis]OWF55324.1 Very long-chain acyl-CoA synthetase [Mizuhopecten yessoensis]
MSNRDRIIFGATGATGIAAMAWRAWYPWLLDDLTTIRSTNRQATKSIQDAENKRFIIDMFEEQVKRVPKKPFILFEDKIYTYEFVNTMANRVANLALTWGLKQGDTVATVIYNQPAFVWTLLGLLKLGLVDAFINYHTKSRPLLHSILVCDAKVLIIGDGDELLESIDTIRDKLPVDMPIYVYGKGDSKLPGGYLSMDLELLRVHPAEICKTVRSELSLKSLVCFIYTSGTTGLPKPAIINQAKAIGLSKFYQQIWYNEADTVYVVTPLYHSAACGHGLFNTIDVGATLVLRQRFSARYYWEDVRKYKVTVLPYIGELCRYLLRVPQNDLDGVHSVRVAVGNGLRPDIWNEYRTRFKIPWIVEFFGATEGTTTFINVTGQVGAIGRWSPLMRVAAKGRFGVTSHVIKYDVVNNIPVRNDNGRCIPIKKGEEGVPISGIPPSYSGFYKGDIEASQKKILIDVFEEGDRYFNFGDLVYMDAHYNLYFRDRVGDTFRWKGENVSTREVCDVISTLPFTQDVNVYGVRVPDSDGRAGMAAISLKGEKDVQPEMLQAIFRICETDLPAYARPLFLRFQKEFVVTQTMKHRKVDLIGDGLDLGKITDPVYYLDVVKRTYSPLTWDNYQHVVTSRL